MLGEALDKKLCLYRHEINAMHGAAPTKNLMVAASNKNMLGAASDE